MRPVIRMHACDYDRSAAHGAQWQELELIFGRLLQHGNIRERRDGSSVCVSNGQLDQRKRSCVRVVDPQKLQVSVYKNAQTIFSWLLPGLKDYYNTPTQPVSVSPRHAKRCMRYVYICKQRLVHFSYTEAVTCMRVLHKDEICFTLMDAILKQS